jgi:hypothetical protein
VLLAAQLAYKGEGDRELAHQFVRCRGQA